MVYPRIPSSQPAPGWSDFTGRLNRICERLWTLTHIDWCFDISPRHDNNASSLAAESFLSLWKTKNLQSLSLSFNEFDYNARVSRVTSLGDAVIDRILENSPSWPCFEHLRLSFDTSHMKLLPFFQFLSPSLRSLELTDMQVGDAGQLVARIPKILKLDSVRLSSIWHTEQGVSYQCLFPESTDIDAPLERAVRSYLLRQTNEIPDLGLNIEI